ncbi:MAG: CBS domain-containing protein [Alphaproteobacteria bacterium]|jgi:CIC family chloride channel protein|nr:CBS domain-containing protein [Alphaproteobacteria bacterium]
MAQRPLAKRQILVRSFLRLRRLNRNDQMILALLAVLIGVGVAGAEIAFRFLLSSFQYLAYGHGEETLLSHVRGLPWWQVLLAPAAGGLLVGLILRWLVPGGRPLGVPHVMAACALRGGRMSLRAGLGAAVVSAASLGTGASTGREGPVVHLGATISAWVARRLKLSAALSRTLLGCGVAGAVAASFNAPIAGVFFALEVVVGHYALSAFAPIVLASVTATILSRLHYGDFPAFVLPETYPIASFWEFPAFALLGVVSAVVAVAFMFSVMTVEDAAERTRLPRVVRPMLGGLAVGAIALAFPHVLGVGYEATDLALREQLGLGLLLALIVAKTAATALSLGMGFGGGVFSPSLFLGAMTGGAFGLIATSVFPEFSSGHGAYTLVGMGAVAGAVLGAPISTILIVFEMTGDYALTIAVMVAVAIASVLTQEVLGRSFFTWQLERSGISLKGGREIGLLAQIKVSDVMKRDYAAIAPEASLDQVRAKLRGARYGELFVLEDDNRLVGVITITDLAQREDDAAEAGREPRRPPTAADLARTDPPMLEAEDEIRDAMGLMDTAGESHLPVVDSKDARRVVGFVHEHDVVLAYQRALLQARAEERGESVPDSWRRR